LPQLFLGRLIILGTGSEYPLLAGDGPSDLVSRAAFGEPGHDALSVSVGDDALAISFFGRFCLRGPKMGPTSVISLQKERTRIVASPCLFKSSGGRIRTSDLRVMSVISSKSKLL
jgi:hypothetical protein